MVLIFGGVYQGKLDYAMGRFNVTTDDVFVCKDDITFLPIGCKVYNDFDKWILALVQKNENIRDNISKFIAENPNAIVIANDNSCGVVPIDANLRIWREENGRALGQIAQVATEVVRMYCGIATIIKQC